MMQDINKEAINLMDQAVGHTRMELAKVRTGRANPDLLNSIQVDYYGSMMPLNQVSTISIPEPRLITLQPFEKTLIPIIEKAIMDSNLGLTPSNNGNSVMVPIPALSEERRKDLIKYVHQLIEEGRISIRNVRRDALHHVKDFGQEEHISEDEIRREESEIQTLTDKHVATLNEMQDHKEKELMEF
ncbi:MAG: ribosome recycling factor [Candidatus Marinimicrobia bacterium]|jgi:ribosome recycling factor|nr:ribosome recycling factor [Candidatus Neomarinimicrobiota bacterium]MBT3676167.1 ribosome recycling factor [Candidatus Neomarinimicrobiota bacterium]MBT3763057.1 ribosome recycling factor [Candidatus Neomarinimicrobiota bacterium]MBT4068314.1 ribosome recycling factor [Candidatus Neomarinimicrobiota bacterium]MBT4270639.1 ribosome recycling factor [Candidatus Neomarinimicrobiota bacterium]